MKNKWLILTLLSLLLIATFILGYKCANNVSGGQEQSPDTITVSDTIWKDTTIFKDKLVPKYIKVVKTDTVFTEEGDTIQLVTENKTYQDTLICDKDTAELQIFTSGIKSNVDSINLSLRKSEIIKTNTIEITKYVDKKKTFWDRFHIGLQAGYGYGFNYKGLEPYIGLGGSFDL